MSIRCVPFERGYKHGDMFSLECTDPVSKTTNPPTNYVIVLLTLRNRHERKATWHETEAPEYRWRSYSYEEFQARDKTSLKSSGSRTRA